MVAAISASLCAAETNPASKADGAKVVAGVEHGVEEAVEGFLVAFQHFSVGLWATGAEVEAEHAADRLRREGDAVPGSRGDQTVA